jgi:hypothetical protein
MSLHKGVQVHTHRTRENRASLREKKCRFAGLLQGPRSAPGARAAPRAHILRHRWRTRRRCATVARHSMAVRSGFRRWERRAQRPPLSCSIPHRGRGFGLSAEGEGFEPSRDLAALSDFRDLKHLAQPCVLRPGARHNARQFGWVPAKSGTRSTGFCSLASSCQASNSVRHRVFGSRCTTSPEARSRKR